MKTIATLGVDLAKDVFHLHGVDARGHTVLERRITRRKLPEFIATLPACFIGMESCGGSNYWSRVCTRSGHEVRRMNPKFVKPDVKSQKNERNDAEAIGEALRRPNKRFGSTKTVEQQNLQMLHRSRRRLVGQRTALVNQTRGFLHEYGIVMAQGVSSVRRRVPEILEDATNELTSLTRELVAQLYDELCALDERVEGFEMRLKAQFRDNSMCQRLAKVEGIFPVSATALVATVGDASVFDSGRGLAAWMGLVPKQTSTGGRPRLGSISKRGDRYLRSLLIHGARSVIQHLGEKQDRRSCWLRQLVARRGKNVASVALANKNARIIWALMTHDEDYRTA